jgi:hypothetical protein
MKFKPSCRLITDNLSMQQLIWLHVSTITPWMLAVEIDVFASYVHLEIGVFIVTLDFNPLETVINVPLSE